MCSFDKSPSCVFIPAVTEGTSRSTGSCRATRPTGKALLWPWPFLPRPSQAPATFHFHFTLCLTKHKLHALLPIRTSSSCKISTFKLLWLWNRCRVAEMIRSVRLFVLSSFIFSLFDAKFEERVELLLHTMSCLNNTCFDFAGCCRSHWAQRKQRRQRPYCKTRQCYLQSYRSFFLPHFNIFIYLSCSLSFLI